MDIRSALIDRLDEARQGFESVLARIDPGKAIYPGWSLKQLLDHIAGWDDAVIASIQAHIDSRVPGTPAERGIDYYNRQTVSARESLDFLHSLGGFRAAREQLKSILREIPDKKLAEPLILPWGPEGSISEVIEIFAHHEQEHTADLLRWLEDPGHMLSP